MDRYDTIDNYDPLKNDTIASAAYQIFNAQHDYTPSEYEDFIGGLGLIDPKLRNAVCAIRACYERGDNFGARTFREALTNRMAYLLDTKYAGQKQEALAFKNVLANAVKTYQVAMKDVPRYITYRAAISSQLKPKNPK